MALAIKKLTELITYSKDLPLLPSFLLIYFTLYFSCLICHELIVPVTPGLLQAALISYE